MSGPELVTSICVREDLFIGESDPAEGTRRLRHLRRLGPRTSGHGGPLDMSADLINSASLAEFLTSCYN